MNRKKEKKDMKQKSILLAMLLALVAVFSTSCEDMLTVDTGDKSYTNANDTLYSYLGIVKGLQKIAERQVILNEVRGDLTASTEYVTDTLHAISNFDDPQDGSCSLLNISDYYAIINNCNFYIANADTNKVKSNVKYMIPEYAQVQAIRAWTYLQLVNIYGEVPFISEPIKNLDVVNNFDYNNNLVNKDNLIDKFLELGLDRYVATSYPNYGNYNNGFTNISSQLLFIPVRLVLGDMYLLRGESESDYRKAAQYYYDYLKTTNSTITAQYCSARRTMGEYTYSSVGNWGTNGSVYTRQATSEVISIIPSSSNKQFGTMLTRIADIYGYTPSSSQSTETTTTEEGDEDVSSSGRISVVRNYKAQIVPSNGYTTLNKEQQYVDWVPSTLVRTYYDECGDARYHYSTEVITHEGNSYTLACKAAKGSTFYYSVPIYRKTLVWLRLAEAINRAGFPEHAFGILKDGLNDDNYPVPNLEREVEVPVLDEYGDPVLDELGNPVTTTETEVYTRYKANGALNYIDDEELANFFLDFSDDLWISNYGIHARGCGYGTWTRTSTTVAPVTNITGDNDDTYFAWEPVLLSKGVDPTTASKEDIINAIEDVICDELALELAFEGYRFSDLVRMANHKNASGYDGTEWLAHKIGYRNAREESSDHTIKAVEPDLDLYEKLKNQNLWYLTKPAWSGK